MCSKKKPATNDYVRFDKEEESKKQEEISKIEAKAFRL
jgi:hypothetical protein